MRGRACIVVAVGCAWLVLAAAPAAEAQLLPPAPKIGEDRGVTIKRAGRTLVVSFRRSAARRFRYIAGRRVVVECIRLPRRRSGSVIESELEVNQLAPRKRRPFRLPGIPRRPIDYCEVRAPSRAVRRNGRKRRSAARDLATVALTPAGATFLDERDRAIALLAVLVVASLEDGDGGTQTYPTTQSFVARSDGIAVALDSPQATPPPRRVGYWSDGAEHAAFVVLSSAGRRLYIEVDTDERISTNVARYLPFLPR